MSTTSPKQPKVAKTLTKLKEGISHLSSPLMVDPQSWRVVDAEPLDALTAPELFRVDLTAGASATAIKKTVADLAKKGLLVFYTAHGHHGQLTRFGGKSAHTSEQVPEMETLRIVLAKTLESAKEVQLHHAGRLSTNQFIRQVAETLADKVDAGSKEASVTEGWQQLLEQGLKSKTALLKSKEFKSTSEASELLGIGEHAVRKRIKQQRLFALRMPGDGEHRIPAWALDPKLGGATAAALLAQAGEADEWRVYHFMSTPNGSFNGLRPFECLMSNENLPPAQLRARSELLSYLRLPETASLLEPIRQALKADLEESPEK